MSATKLLNALTEELEDTWGYTVEEINDIQEKILVFAKAVSESPTMTEELHKITKDL